MSARGCDSIPSCASWKRPRPTIPAPCARSPSFARPARRSSASSMPPSSPISSTAAMPRCRATPGGPRPTTSGRSRTPSSRARHCCCRAGLPRSGRNGSRRMWPACWFWAGLSSARSSACSSSYAAARDWRRRKPSFRPAPDFYKPRWRPCTTRSSCSTPGAGWSRGTRRSRAWHRGPRRAKSRRRGITFSPTVFRRPAHC